MKERLLLTHCSHHFDPWGSTGGKDRLCSTYQLVTTGSECFGQVETGSIPVSATNFLLTPTPDPWLFTLNIVSKKTIPNGRSGREAAETAPLASLDRMRHADVVVFGQMLLHRFLS